MYLKHTNMGCLKLNTIPLKEGLEKRFLRLEKGLETDFSCFKSCFNSFTYGFQGQETDEEWLGGAVSYKYRVHDARIGRFLSVDPLAPDYPHNSPYAFSENRVIDSGELEGLERYYAADGRYLGQIGRNNFIRVVNIGNEDLVNHFNNHPNTGNYRMLNHHSVPLNAAALSEVSNVYQSIYDENIGGYLVNISAIEEEYGLGGRTPDEDNIEVNRENTKNDEKLNNNYFNLLATLMHEEAHRQSWQSVSGEDGGNGGNDFNTHKEITLIPSKNLTLWNQMTPNGQKFHRDVFRSNYIKPLEIQLGEMQAADPDKFSASRKAQYLLKLYSEIVDQFNETMDANYEPKEFD